MNFKVEPTLLPKRKTNPRFTVDCSDEMRNQIDVAAKKANVSRSEFMRQALRYVFNNMAT